MDDWQAKLGKLETAIDGEEEGPKPELSEDHSTPDKSRTRVLRWTIIGVGAGLGLALAYYILKPLLILLIVAGVGYGGYRFWKMSSDKSSD